MSSGAIWRRVLLGPALNELLWRLFLGIVLGMFIRRSHVDRPHHGSFMGYIMLGVFGQAAWGLSWVVLGLFLAYLNNLAGIYCLLEAIFVNLANLFERFAIC